MEKTGQAEAVSRTIILEDVDFMGDIKVVGDLLVMGKVKGNIHCLGQVVMLKGAFVSGNVNSTGLDLSGMIEGDVETGTLILHDTALVKGAVEARVVRIFGEKVNVALLRLSKK